jgi:dTDP-4-dehydrorhamnose reductase
MICVTGGSGRLGTELKKILEADYPTHDELDITKPIKKGKYDMVIHCAGYTNVAMSKQESKLCYLINVEGTKNLLKAYKNTPFVFISSEYAVNPTTYYSETKQLAEREVVKHPKHLIIRTLFKPRPYPFDRAFYDQYTMGDYVDIIAELIMNEVYKWDAYNNPSKLIYVGTGRKSIYDLAKQTKPKVKKESVSVINWVKLPHDYL